MECIELEGFTDIARDHAINPRNHGILENYTDHARITGPCGDTMEFWLIVQNGILDKISFITDGCGSSLACGSMATMISKDMPIEKAQTLQQIDILNALGGLPQELEHCALLAANTLKEACRNHLKSQNLKNQ